MLVHPAQVEYESLAGNIDDRDAEHIPEHDQGGLQRDDRYTTVKGGTIDQSPVRPAP